MAGPAIEESLVTASFSTWQLTTMDIDPLEDSAPPRHAVESDEEDEFHPLSSKSSQEPNVDIQTKGDIKQGLPVAIVTGEVGKSWARGAKLGEQTGSFIVNGVQVGLLFEPSWTKATVVVSETTTRLPTWAMNAYAGYVIDSLNPSRLAVLDTYPVPAYIAAHPLPYHESPLRYLSSDGSVSLPSNIEPFAPPNLLSSTVASFISILVFRSASAPNCMAILVPSAHNPPPPPAEIAPISLSLPVYDQFSTETIILAQSELFSTIDEQISLNWDTSNSEHETIASNRKKGDIGEGGMYI